MLRAIAEVFPMPATPRGIYDHTLVTDLKICEGLRRSFEHHSLLLYLKHTLCLDGDKNYSNRRLVFIHKYLADSALPRGFWPVCLVKPDPR